MAIKTDFHMHSSFSGDSNTPMEEMVQKAISLGFSHICFTEHYDPDYVYSKDEKEGCFEINTDSYLYDLLKLKAKYKNTDFIKTQLAGFSKVSELQKGKENFIAINNQLLTAEDFGCNLKTYHFDFKQFLCHLMGILQYQKENKVKVHFYYLFFKHTDYVNKERSKIYEELELELEEIFSIFSKKYNNIDFGYIYNDKFDTIKNIENNYT